MRRTLFWAVVGGLLIALLKVLEYKHFVRAYPTGLYGGIVALIFTGVGAWLALRWTRRPDIVVREVRIREGGPFEPDLAKARELGITPREQEILGLIARGLSNREIGEKIFVSENTVKSHSSRLFDKLGVRRRVQAVQRGRELGLVE